MYSNLLENFFIKFNITINLINHLLRGLYNFNKNARILYIKEYFIHRNKFHEIFKNRNSRANIYADNKQNTFSEVFKIILDSSSYVDPLKVIENKNITKLSRFQCLEAYKFCMLYGDLTLALFFRDNLISKRIRSKNKSLFLDHQYIAALLEKDKFSVVSNLISKKRFLLPYIYDKIMGAVSVKDYVYSLNIILKKCSLEEIPSRYYEPKYDSTNANFSKYLSGKSVAIVGPSPVKSNNGEEIDNFDVVIRPNFQKKSNVPHEKYGKRTNVVYYNRNRVKLYLDEILKVISELDWVVFRTQSDINSFKSRELGKLCRVSSVANHLLFLDSYLQGIPVILNDVIQFAPSRIKVFSTNFFCSQEQYSNNYKPTYIPQNLAVAAHALRIHEPFAGFSFMKNLFNRGLFEGDETTSEILRLSRNQYAKKLQSIYGEIPVYDYPLRANVNK